MNFGVIALSFCKALLSTGNVLLVAVTALIGQTLSPDPIWATLPVAFQFIGLMCATIPASLVMDKIGRKNGFYLGNALGIVGALLSIQALYSASFNLFCIGTSALALVLYTVLLQLKCVRSLIALKRFRSLWQVVCSRLLQGLT